MFSVRLPDDIQARLNKLAQETGRTKSSYVREALLVYLEDMEDIYLSEQRLINVQAGLSLTHTLDEVAREYEIGPYRSEQ